MVGKQHTPESPEAATAGTAEEFPAEKMLEWSVTQKEADKLAKEQPLANSNYVVPVSVWSVKGSE